MFNMDNNEVRDLLIQVVNAPPATRAGSVCVPRRPRSSTLFVDGASALEQLVTYLDDLESMWERKCSALVANGRYCHTAGQEQAEQTALRGDEVNLCGSFDAGIGGPFHSSEPFDGIMEAAASLADTGAASIEAPFVTPEFWGFSSMLSCQVKVVKKQLHDLEPPESHLEAKHKALEQANHLLLEVEGVVTTFEPTTQHDTASILAWCTEGVRVAQALIPAATTEATAADIRVEYISEELQALSAELEETTHRYHNPVCSER